MIINNNNNSLVFRIPISKKEVEDILLRYFQSEMYINAETLPYFVEMKVEGKKFLLEFVIK